ncbi:MAG: 16S rRNA processing protein RimM [Chloroflexia bacterium]|nr:16S rRNA processing protein RimM [Chloroflexia bacterium]
MLFLAGSMSDEQLLLIGQIVAPFGVQGQLKVRGLTDRPDYIARHVTRLTLQVGKQRAQYTMVQLHEHKPGQLVLTLEGVASREAAEDLRGAEIYIHESEAAPLADNEYFIHQLIGLKVVTVADQAVGTVREVLTTGAGEILVITRPGQPDALVPMVHTFINRLDLAAGVVVIDPIEGLL